MSNHIKVAFDLGNSSLKVAAWKKEGLELHELPLPENLMAEDNLLMPHAFSAFLKKAKKELRLPGGPAGLLLPASKVICRLVTMPRMSVDQLMLNLPYEFSDFVHGEPHQYYCDYALCQDESPEPAVQDEPGEEQLTMMAAVVQRQQIQDYIRIFAAGGFTLRRILPQEMSLIQLVQSCRRQRPEAPREFCFIDVGFLSTRIFVVHGDRIQAARRVPIGCRALDGVVADLFNMDPFLADAYKRGNHQGVLEHPRCMEVYESMAVEVLKVINFYHFTYRQNQLEGVYLIGGGAAIEPLRRMLEDTLGLPALPVEPLIPGGAGKGYSTTFAGAAGLIAQPEKEG
jgi:type IV pilus assembly protein PilM